MRTFSKEVEPRPELTRGEETLLCSLIERRCGQWFSEERLYVLRSCLGREMERLGIGNVGDYYHLLVRDTAAWNSLLDRSVNRETLFFRHMASFTALADELLPAIQDRRARRGESRIALWSAGCSSGEETYSMAIAAREASPTGYYQFDVLGTDLSGEALALARRAHYNARSVAAMPEKFQRRYLARNGTQYEVSADIKAMVRFERFNFADVSTYPAELQDVILCQNVFIYFREATSARVAASLARRLRSGGFLVPAPGELAGLALPELEWLRLDNTMVLRRRGEMTHGENHQS